MSDFKKQEEEMIKEREFGELVVSARDLLDRAQESMPLSEFDRKSFQDICKRLHHFCYRQWWGVGDCSDIEDEDD